MAEIGKIMIKVPGAIKKGDVIPVKAMVVHPMETGQRKDSKTQNLIPEHYINDVKVYYGSDMVTSMEWGIAVSTNPFITFYLKADKAAPLKMVFKDNKGASFEQTVQVNPQ